MWATVLSACLCCCLGQACPGGYVDTSTGSVPVSEHFGSAVSKSTVDECADECSLQEDCLSFEYTASSQLCQLNVLALPTSQTPASGAEFCSKDTYLGWHAVNLMANEKSFRVNAGGDVMLLGSVPEGNLQAFPGPVTVIGQRDDGLVVEWANLVQRGREFSWQVLYSGQTKFRIYAIEDSDVTIELYGITTVTQEILAGNIYPIASVGARQIDFSSTGDILITADTAPVPPAAESIFGQCSTVCHISVFGGNDSISLTRTCTNDTTDTVAPGRYWQSGADYNGETCVWSAPSGYKINGHADEDGSGVEGSAFQTLEDCQVVTPLLDPMDFVSFVSDQSAVCTQSAGGSTFTLAGKNGVYHARVASPPAGTVVTCSAPVSAVGRLSNCSSTPLDSPCTNKVLNLVTAVAFSTTTTTTTASSSTTSSTSGTDTTSTISSLTLTTTSSTITASATLTTHTTSETTTASLTATTTMTHSTTASLTMTTVSTTSSTSTGSTTTASTSTETATVTSTASTSSTATSTSSTSTSITSTESTSTTASSTATSVTASTTTSSVSITTWTTATATTTTTTTSSTTTVTATTTTVSTATTSTTSSTESTTTTEAFAPDPLATTTTTSLAVPSELVKQVEKVESTVLAGILAGNETSSILVVDGYTVVAAVLQPAAAASGTNNLTVAVEGSDAQVTVPISVFEDLGVDGLILVVSYVDPSSTALLDGSAGENSEVLSAVNVNLFNLAGDLVTVDGLERPVEIVLPASWNSSMECGYWDELDQRWSSKGIVTDKTPDGLLLCKAHHLTFFAAILRGFIDTFKCSQLVLLSAEGVAELARSGWSNTDTAWAFWALILAFVLLLLCAAALDRWGQKTWTDENFLIANDECMSSPSDLPDPGEGGGGGGGGCMACLMGWLCSCTESAALRDALDDVLSNWFGYFGEVRSFIEGLWEGMELNCGCFCNLPKNIMGSMIAQSARRQAAASLGVSGDSAMFVLEHEDAHDLLRAGSSSANNGDFGGDTVAVTKAPSTQLMGDLHERVGGLLAGHLHRSASWCLLPCSILRLFFWGSPFGAAFVRCIFFSRALRVMFFMVDIFGALTLGALFFQSEGGFVSKRSRFQGCGADDDDDDSSTSFGEYIGRLLAIGVVSMLFAGLPSAFLQSVPTRSVKRFDSRGCPEWKKQLKIWRTQDRIVWTLAILYVGFCAFFITLFLANVAPEDLTDWTLSGVISLAEDILVIPFSVALVLPLLSLILLSLVSCIKGVEKQELIRERFREMQEEHANLKVPVGYI